MLKQVSSGWRWHVCRAFTLVELLVVMGIIVLLLAILLPVLSGMRVESRAIVCANNLRQLGIGLTTYAAENKGRFPPNTTVPKPAQSWCDSERLGRFVKLPIDGVLPDSSAYVCPSDENVRRSYSMNLWASGKVDPLSAKKGSVWCTGIGPEVILLADAWAVSGTKTAGWVAPVFIGLNGTTAGQKFGGAGGIMPTVATVQWGNVNCELAYMRHRKLRGPGKGTQPKGRVNICFADGHVALLADTDLVDGNGESTGLAYWTPDDTK